MTMGRGKIFPGRSIGRYALVMKLTGPDTYRRNGNRFRNRMSHGDCNS
jgi:hypothetical protein